jgi:hypothetical protein
LSCIVRSDQSFVLVYRQNELATILVPMQGVIIELIFLSIFPQALSNNLDNKLREDLERLKKIRAHRGLRHYWGYVLTYNYFFYYKCGKLSDVRQSEAWLLTWS